jgi:DUF3035 family protein
MRVDTVAFRPRRAILLAVVLLCSITLLSGCGFRQLIGLDKVGPDEFAVESRAPLTIPPDYELRPPAPGASRPQEVTAAERARRAIDTAGPGEPGKQAGSGLRVPEGGLRRPDTADSQQAADQAVADKLLGYSAQQGGAEKRETTTLKGVY